MKGLNPEVYTDIVITEGLETPDGPLDSRVEAGVSGA